MKIGDRVLIVVVGVVLAGAALWFALGGAKAASPSPLVVVTQSKSGFYQVNQITDDIEFTVETPGTGEGADADHGENVVRIHDGHVEVVEADCENQLCVQHAPISQAGEQIVCLPHGVVVQVAERADDIARLS